MTNTLSSPLYTSATPAGRGSGIFSPDRDKHPLQSDIHYDHPTLDELFLPDPVENGSTVTTYILGTPHIFARSHTYTL
jgi:hypothetical protein